MSARLRVAISGTGPAYVDVDTTGTDLEYVGNGYPISESVYVNATADLARAGAANGGVIGARVSAAHTIRLALMGNLTGGTYDFLFTAGG